jgi:lipoprotein-releasing system ATP-binding protein
LHESHGLTSIVVTHNMELAARCGRTLKLENGRLIQVTDAGPMAPQAGHIH